MPGPVTDAHRLIYKENVRLQLQEKRAQFDDLFEFVEGPSGKQVQVTDILGTSEARLDAPEGGDTPDVEVTHEPVWARPRRLDWGKVITKDDAIKALTDFKSPYVTIGVNAMTRRKNEIMAAAVFGDRLIGNEVPVATPWAGRTVAENVGGGGSPTGFNTKKILNGIKLMENDEVVIEEEQLVLGLDPQEIEDLYNDVQFISKDYRNKAVLDDDNRAVSAIFGIPIARTKRFANADSDTSTAGLWAKSGMHWGQPMALDVQSSRNPNKQYREHPYMEMWIFATRSEDFKTVKILNKF